MEIKSIIEGYFQGEEQNLRFKISTIEIPKTISILVDKNYIYYSYKKNSGEIFNIENLTDCEGLVLPYLGGIGRWIDRPRALITKDKRFFIEESYLKSKNYIESLISQNFNSIFNAKTVEEINKIVGIY